jgi:hypothetical protein
MAYRAADMRANASSCTESSVTRAAARLPVKPLQTTDRNAAHWQKREGFATPRPLPIRVHDFAKARTWWWLG